MKSLRTVVWLFRVILYGYLMAIFVGTPLFLLMMFFLLTGRIKIRGYWRFIGGVLKGRALILSNHPTLLAETFFLGSLTMPWALIFPHAFLWTVPDKKLLNDWDMPHFLRAAFRCIIVDRSSTETSFQGMIEALSVLKWRFSIIGHPEMGRTGGNANKDRTPLERNGRLMQDIGRSGSGLTIIAQKAKARILPLWVEVPYCPEAVPINVSFRRMFGKRNAHHRPIIYHFGEAYFTKKPFDRVSENRSLQEKIFGA